jgi:hypothetical protein
MIFLVHWMNRKIIYAGVAVTVVLTWYEELSENTATTVIK